MAHGRQLVPAEHAALLNINDVPHGGAYISDAGLGITCQGMAPPILLSQLTRPEYGPTGQCSYCRQAYTEKRLGDSRAASCRRHGSLRAEPALNVN